MNKTRIEKVEAALRLHCNYLGKYSCRRYLKAMDELAAGYSGSLSEKVSKLLDDYYKKVGVLDLNEALLRLREIDKQDTCKQNTNTIGK